MKKTAVNQLKGVYTPYKAMETHLERSIKLHDSEDLKSMERSNLEYEAGILAQECHMDKPELIEAYKQFCKDNNIQAQLD